MAAARRCGLASTAWAASGGSPCARRWAGSAGRMAIRAPATGSTSSTSMSSRAGSRRPRTCSSSTACTAAGMPESACGRERIAVGDQRIGFTEAALPGDVAWGDLGCDIVLECTGKFLTPEQLQAYFDRGVKRVIVAAPVKHAGGAQHRRRRQRPALRSRPAPAADRRLLHHQLPGAGGQGGPRGDRHPARPDHDHPRSDQHQCRRRCAAQGSAARTLGDAVAAADDDGQCHRDRADLSGAEGQAQRPRGARAGAQRQPHRLRVRTDSARPAKPRSTRCSTQPRKGPLAGILGYETRPLVSVDYCNDTRSSIVDAPSTMVTDGTLLKVYAWYDNEIGYAAAWSISPTSSSQRGA